MYFKNWVTENLIADQTNLVIELLNNKELNESPIKINFIHSYLKEYDIVNTNEHYLSGINKQHNLEKNKLIEELANLIFKNYIDGELRYNTNISSQIKILMQKIDFEESVLEKLNINKNPFYTFCKWHLVSNAILIKIYTKCGLPIVKFQNNTWIGITIEDYEYQTQKIIYNLLADFEINNEINADDVINYIFKDNSIEKIKNIIRDKKSINNREITLLRNGEYDDKDFAKYAIIGENTTYFDIKKRLINSSSFK